MLRAANHDVAGIAVDGTPECLRALMQLRPDLIFNLVESFGDDNSKEPHVAAYYELLGLPYTGSSPRGLTLAMDKAVAKKILGFHNVVSPKFAVFWRGRLDWDADDVEFPVIVKPLREDGSIGIGFDALAGNIKELMERIDSLTGEFNGPILIEQYVEGREIYMGVLGNSPPEALPPVELDLSHLPKGTPSPPPERRRPCIWAAGTCCSTPAFRWFACAPAACATARTSYLTGSISASRAASTP